MKKIINFFNSLDRKLLGFISILSICLFWMLQNELSKQHSPISFILSVFIISVLVGVWNITMYVFAKEIEIFQGIQRDSYSYFLVYFIIITFVIPVFYIITFWTNISSLH